MFREKNYFKKCLIQWNIIIFDYFRRLDKKFKNKLIY